ncbi:FecR family protein [Saccharospirillum salsuginis]|uniref:FecR protein domain-containing protein n=1 Tax=Saccharospirillum salsuginis TaxID=418750 RepID=A0A918KH81_9GAMM|nr:FecR family protein [Saccharospirillum salsuginis]GGX63419.1 hypothetical protein GCM10007392_34140 [Saccharospirillum salsuginis]
MMNRLNTLRLASLIALLLCPALLWASIGKVVIARGDVYALDGNEQRRALQRRSDVFEGDTIVTGADGSLQIRFKDNAILALRAESQLKITEYHGTDADNDRERVLMDLLAGGFRTITGSIGKTDQDAYQVRTPNASIGIRGTHYEALIQTGSLLLGVYQGGIRIANDNGELNLGADSEFIWGRVNASGRPQGLLNPPDELNTPISPEAEGNPEPQPEDEPRAQLNEEDAEGIPLEEAFAEPVGEEPPEIPDTTDVTTTELDTGDDIQLATVDDEIEEQLESGEIITDARLTDAQIEALQTDPRYGLVVLTDSFGDAVHYGYIVDGDNGPVFVNYDTESMTELDNGYVTPDRVFKGPELTSPTSLATHDLGNTTVEWGIWNASTTDQAALYEDPTSALPTELDSNPFYYVFAEPTKIAERTGTGYFSTYECENAGGDSPCSSITITLNDTPQTVDYFDGSLNVNFDDATGTGNVYLGFGGDMYWDIGFEGNLKGSQFNADTVTSSNLNTLQNTFSGGTNGEVNGYFTGSDTNLHFIGGFGFDNQDAGAQVEGVMLMQEGAVLD